MDILYRFKQNGYFTAELYHLLHSKKTGDPSETIIPSEYMTEMMMDSQKRLQSLNNIEINNLLASGNILAQKVLSFLPSIIVFQNFKPNEKLTAKFSIKNVSKAPVFLNMAFKESSYFFVKPCSGQMISRLAPGISVKFIVNFLPLQYEDYAHKISFFTENDQYVLPLIAMGPRPLLNFPDKLSIPPVPVKTESHALMSVKNIGNMSTGFTLSTKSPFSIRPESFYLKPNEKVDVEVKFKSLNLGQTSGTLFASFETGERFRIQLNGTSQIVSVELEKQIIRFPDTYNTMVRQQTLKIINKSNYLLTYMCMKNESVYHDFEEKVKLAKIFYNLKDKESAKSAKLVQYGIMSCEEHERVYTRIFFDEVQALVVDEKLFFQNMHFTINPIKGKLWPNESTDLTVTFAPKELGEINASLYLDIEGVADRVPLTMVGTSMPPLINLNLETLNMDRVYINKTYNYEVVAINRGHINGVIEYKEIPPLFGSVINCIPKRHCLRAGDKETFIVSFCNSNQGPYFEEVNFTIRDTDIVLKLYLKGEVIYPSLTFSLPCLDFGVVSLGVPKTLELDVINESVVQVRASVKISSDGPEISSITLTDYAVASKPKPNVPQWPREFNIEPSNIDMGPESRITLRITLTANLIRTNQTSLEIELEKSDSAPIVLPVVFSAVVPEIVPAQDIKLRACFIDFPYQHEIKITSNQFWGYFTVDEIKEQSTLEVDVAVKECLIEPNSTICLPVTIKTSVLGEQEFIVRLHLFGLTKPIDICRITGCGVRPIVTCSPMALHWGQVKLLTKSQKVLTLCNDSPVTVTFRASLLNKDSHWSIRPSEGYIDPESETDLFFTLYLIDADLYTNKAVIQLEKVKEILVPLSATGIGTSIVVGELQDHIVLGRHFTRVPFTCKVIMENFGTRLHALEWSEHYKAPKNKQPTVSFFTLEPKAFKMGSGEKMELAVSGTSSKITTVKETWYLIGSIEGVNKKELLLECQITAEFVDPNIEISSPVVELQYDHGPYSEYYKLTDIISIKNVAKLPLDLDITVKPPFAIIQKQNTYKIQPDEENLCCCIRYNENDLNLPSINSEYGPRKSQELIDFLTLKPVEPLRLGPLKFFEDIHKIKKAFTLTHSVEERLEDEEIMKLQILFDTTKHSSLKSKVYSDLMKIKFKGHKNKDAIKLIGTVNFPNLLVLSPKVDFQCLLNESVISKTIKIQNVTPLLVCYMLHWKKYVVSNGAEPQPNTFKRSSYASDIKAQSDETESNVTSANEMIECRASVISNFNKDFDNYPKSMNTEALVNGHTTSDLTSSEEMKSNILQILTPMLYPEYDENFCWVSKFPKKCKDNKFEINQICQVIPHRGILKPDEIQYIHVIFRPPPNVSVRAILECEVLGGPPESVLVTGQSSDLRYNIDAKRVNFGIRSFYEKASLKLSISNVAQLPFELKTYLNEPMNENVFDALIIDLIPQQQVLEPEEIADINILVYPGVTGCFNRNFLLEIGHLPYFPIEVCGWGVIPQVYIVLPRPDICQLNVEFGYEAISTLTLEYLEAVGEIFHKNNSEHLNTPLVEKCFEDPFFQCDWHICSPWDYFPSKMDIELAIERKLVVYHLKQRPEILRAYSTSNKNNSITGFSTTPYVIDFGVVITGTTVHRIIEVINYGPVPTKLHFAKGTQFPTWLTMKLCGKLNPGDTGKLEVVFSPSSDDFPELEDTVDTCIYSEVPFGVTIPIKVKSICAVPYLVSSVKEIHFGSVRCGDKIICSIPLKNIGKPTCIWYVTLKLKTSGPNPMMILDSSGKYEPGEGGWLSIAFKPTLEMTYEGILIFRFHMNPNRMTIPVYGQGVVPHVHVIGPNVDFPPTLPWAETNYLYFGITNPCSFPIEIIIAHSDEKWKEEDEIYQLLHKYYSKPDEMLVPAIKPGIGFPPEVVNFYKKFTEQVRKIKDDEASAATAANLKTPLKKPGKNPKSTTKSTTPKESSPRIFRTEAEIIADEIIAMKDRQVDPLKECLHVFENLSTVTEFDKHSKGIIIFVHGSPCEEIQCQEIAYSIGKKLKIPTINIDLCIVEALCTLECSAKTLIMNALNECYEMFRKRTTDHFADNENDAANDETLIDNEDEFDMILRKLQYLVINKNIPTPRSKGSEKKKKKSPNSSMTSHSALGALGSTTMFNMDLIQELLSEFFELPKFNKGFVMDSLSSTIFNNPVLVLTTVLKCKHSIWNIHLVLCQSDFNKWAQAHDESQRETDFLAENISKVYEENEIKNIVETVEDMTAEEYENAPPELRSIYQTYGLEERRKKYNIIVKPVNETIKKEKFAKEHSKSLLAVEGSESRKKIKKDDVKAKPTSEYLAMNTKYNEYYKNTYENLINIANNWIVEDCDVGTPLIGLNGQVVGSAQKKTKKKSEVQIQVSEVSIAERGFPLTLITCPCLRYKEAVVSMFSKSQLVQDALKSEQDFDILSSPVTRKEFTVLLPKTFPKLLHEESLGWHFLDEAPIKKCECNPINDLNLLDDATQDNVLNILTKWHCICGKKVTSAQTSTSEIPSASIEKTESSESDTFYPLPLRSVKSCHAPGGRLVLQPGDLVRCKYSFSPHVEGNFSVKRFVEVSGWPESRVTIKVRGICDLPRLDTRPKKMFQNFIRRTMDDTIYKKTYLDDLKMFQFGPIFIGNNRIYEEEYTICLRNSSLITADVDIEFLEETSVFQINKQFIRLEPGCRETVIISAAPNEVGTYNSVLLFCIKDNPEVIAVNISCSGVLPSVEILPLNKLIEYGKHLLYRREDDRFIVRNDSILPIMWKIRNAQEFLKDFIIARTSGIIARQDNQVVPVTYIACSVGVISHKQLIIDIYDEEGRGEPMIVDSIYLSAECYDVMVDCAYENPSENFLNYGNVKVNSTVVREMYLLNRGKYSIYYKLKKVKNFPEPSLLRSFEVEPECGVIPPTLKLISLEFECTPSTSVNLVKEPAYICTLLDSSKSQVVVAKFPVCVTIASFYNTFTLFPLGELNFHIIPVGSGVLREVILNNTSKCPFTYEIVLPSQYQLDPAVQQLPTKGKDNKIKNPPMKCGNFLIMNDDNLLAPGTSKTIQIQFLATAAKKFEETISFIISDTCPAEAQGVPLKLVGTGAMPTLDIWNIETTFREHLIVRDLSEYKVPEYTAHCVFVENSVTLHFFSVTVNTSFTAALDLSNSGLVACALTMKLQYQSNTDNTIFSLDKYETHIEPLTHKKLGIIFRPKALQEYRAVLEIKLKLLENQEQSFRICLIGEGVIPRIKIVAPLLRQNRIALLTFPVTCLGSINTKVIRFKNVSTVISVVVLKIIEQQHDLRPVFWLSTAADQEIDVIENYDKSNLTMIITLKPEEIATINVNYNPLKKGKISCDVKLTIVDNPYEYFTVLCEGESFMEDVILMGIEMLPMDTDLETYRYSGDGTMSTVSTMDSRKKSRSAPVDKKKSKQLETRKTKRVSVGSTKQSECSLQNACLKYVLDFGGCELCSLQKRSIIMINNSEKVYKFIWDKVDYIVVKPSVGYISPGEEKDLEIIFFAGQPVVIKKEVFHCTLTVISDDTLGDLNGATWDNRQTITLFDQNISVNERLEVVLEEQPTLTSDYFSEINMVVIYSAITEYTKYACSLNEEYVLPDTFIYQNRTIDFEVENVGNVLMKIAWTFQIDDEFPLRVFDNVCGSIIEEDTNNVSVDDSFNEYNAMNRNELPNIDQEKLPSKETLFSKNDDRQSVDTWFEVDLPFKVEPDKECLKPSEIRQFRITFSPFEAFKYKVRLRSTIDNLDPYDQNVSCKIIADSLVPFCHLDIEESNYLTSDRRKPGSVVLPPHTAVLEFNVLGSGCYKKSFNVINPTNEPYEFIFEMVQSDSAELVPVHCNKLKGYIEGGTLADVTFTFSPTEPGVYESQWKFLIPSRNLVMNLLIVGTVREPDVVFVPTILVIKNSLVGFTKTDIVILQNNENESLKFEFKGDSLCNDSGKTPVVVEPACGIMKPMSETPIKIIYTPILDGPLSFKLFCSVTHLKKFLTLCVNALSYEIKPKVTYYLIGNEHILNNDALTKIYLDQTASTYERTVPFTIKNDGSATFFFDWRYDTRAVKKYLQVTVEPKCGHVTPSGEVECVLYFTLKQVPVQAFPVTLFISDGPEYNIFLYAEIEKPLYHFTCMDYDFGKCFVNAPDSTYKKNIAFCNNDKTPLTIDLNFNNLPELYVDYPKVSCVEANQRLKIAIFFRPKQVREYEFKLQFWVNSLVEEVVTIKGEGVPLLFDLYEGCQKSFDLGPVKLGEKIIRRIEVMNHSKIPIDASFIFRDMYPVVDNTTISQITSVCLSPSNTNIQADAGPSRGKMLQDHKNDIVTNQIAMDIQNALSSLKVIPNKCKIMPHRKIPLKIQFKPLGMISSLSVQLNMKVLEFEKPLVRLSGSATGMSLCLSQNSLQFGRVRKRGCKVLKVMLLNKGDFGARFWWQPLTSDEFTISPQKGNIAAHTNVTFTITFRPLNHNPFIKVWASCNIENFMPLELALYATCVDIGNVQNKSLYLECPVRELQTEYVVVTNPSDDLWLVLSELSGGPFETLKQFNVEPNSTFEIPVHFKPKAIGKHEFPESYSVSTELVKIIPDKFDGYYEIKHPETIKVWGEAAATCRWIFVCYEACEMQLKVMFVNEVTREYQFYNMIATVTQSQIVDTLFFECQARETIQRELIVSNPLSQDAEFRVKCETLHCPEIMKISRNSESVLLMSYSPLVVGEREDTLEIYNNLVGTYIYRVKLKCLPGKEKNLEFTTSFGTCIPLRLRIQNKTDVKTDFIAEVSHSSIQIDKECCLGPLEKGKILVWFEPTQLGVQNCKVSFKSTLAGEFVFNIKGIATEPKPQGPYEVKAGGSTTIKFKNVFDSSRMFKIYVDREEFYVKTMFETIKPKKDLRISVYLNDKPAQGWTEVPTGCLTIETHEPAEPKVHWTYFLQGKQ
ncbi:hydrocephalus-inducing protein homolog isoform X2 [Bombyx mori]|uniref:hydrocephalus-inducing protein homolog isoform X2 n=1 Tax=Bombyx mori TaxID=7091 RepID=UPI002ED28FFA